MKKIIAVALCLMLVFQLCTALGYEVTGETYFTKIDLSRYFNDPNWCIKYLTYPGISDAGNAIQAEKFLDAEGNPIYDYEHTGVPFTLGAFADREGISNVISSKGQEIALPSAPAKKIHLFVAASTFGGAEAYNENVSFKIKYASGPDDENMHTTVKSLISWRNAPISGDEGNVAIHKQEANPANGAYDFYMYHRVIEIPEENQLRMLKSLVLPDAGDYRVFAVTVESPVIEYTDEDKINDDIVYLNDVIPETTKSDLMLPLSGPAGSSIRWVSDNTDVISETGEVIRDGDDHLVKLYAYISYGSIKDQEVMFEVMIPGFGPGESVYEKIDLSDKFDNGYSFIGYRGIDSWNSWDASSLVENGVEIHDYEHNGVPFTLGPFAKDKNTRNFVSEGGKYIQLYNSGDFTPEQEETNTAGRRLKKIHIFAVSLGFTDGGEIYAPYKLRYTDGTTEMVDTTVKSLRGWTQAATDEDKENVAIFRDNARIKNPQGDIEGSVTLYHRIIEVDKKTPVNALQLPQSGDYALLALTVEYTLPDYIKVDRIYQNGTEVEKFDSGNTEFTIEFNEQIDESSLNDDSIVITDILSNESYKVTGKVDPQNPYCVDAVLTSPLNPASDYKIEINEGVVSKDGMGVSEDAAVAFSTAETDIKVSDINISGEVDANKQAVVSMNIQTDRSFVVLIGVYDEKNSLIQGKTITSDQIDSDRLTCPVNFTSEVTKDCHLKVMIWDDITAANPLWGIIK